MAQEPFHLSADDDDAGAAQGPTEIPSSDADAGAAPSAQPAAEDTPPPAMKECPSGKGPSEMIVKPEPARKGADATGAAGSVKVILDNRRSIPRTVEVTGIERTDGAGPLKVTRVTADEGGGGFPQSKMMLQSQATMHLVVEFDPPAPPPYRVHFSVDDEAACIDSPAGKAAQGAAKTKAPAKAGFGRKK